MDRYRYVLIGKGVMQSLRESVRPRVTKWLKRGDASEVPINGVVSWENGDLVVFRDSETNAHLSFRIEPSGLATVETNMLQPIVVLRRSTGWSDQIRKFCSELCKDPALQPECDDGCNRQERCNAECQKDEEMDLKVVHDNKQRLLYFFHRHGSNLYLTRDDGWAFEIDGNMRIPHSMLNKFEISISNPHQVAWKRFDKTFTKLLKETPKMSDSSDSTITNYTFMVEQIRKPIILKNMESQK